MNTEEHLPDVLFEELWRRCVNIYDRDGNFRGLYGIIVQEISTMWKNGVVSAPNLTKSVFNLDNDDIDDEVELATDEEFKILLGVD